MIAICVRGGRIHVCTDLNDSLPSETLCGVMGYPEHHTYKQIMSHVEQTDAVICTECAHTEITEWSGQ